MRWIIWVWAVCALVGAVMLGATCGAMTTDANFRGPIGFVVVLLSVFVAVTSTVLALREYRDGRAMREYQEREARRPRLAHPLPTVTDDATKADVVVPLPTGRPQRAGDDPDSTEVIPPPNSGR